MSQTLNIPNSSNLLDLNAMNWLESVLGQEELSGITNQIRLSQQSNSGTLILTESICSNPPENFVSFEMLPKTDLSPIFAQIQSNFDAICRENSRLKEELLLAVDNCICKKDDNNSFVCDKCQKQCINAHGLHIHQSRAHPDSEIKPKKRKQPVIDGNSSFACDKCEKQCINSHGLHVHQSRAHSEKKPKPEVMAKPVIEHKCEICQQSFDVWRKLYNHKFTHKIKRERLFKCDLCSKAFFINYDLKKHRLIHTRKTTTTNDKSSEAVVENAQTKRNESFECNKCTKKFTSNFSLLVHKRKHKRFLFTLKGVKCKICNNKFLDNKQLKKHLKTHTVPSNQPID